MLPDTINASIVIILALGVIIVCILNMTVFADYEVIETKVYELNKTEHDKHEVTIFNLKES